MQENLLFFFFSLANTLLNRSSTTTFVSFFFGRRKRGSDFSLTNLGSDMDVVANLPVDGITRIENEIKIELDSRVNVLY